MRSHNRPSRNGVRCLYDATADQHHHLSLQAQLPMQTIFSIIAAINSKRAKNRRQLSAASGAAIARRCGQHGLQREEKFTGCSLHLLHRVLRPSQRAQSAGASINGSRYQNYLCANEKVSSFCVLWYMSLVQKHIALAYAEAHSPLAI